MAASETTETRAKAAAASAGGRPGGSPAARPAAGWRALFVFRGKASREIELVVAILTFLGLAALWVIVTALELVAPQFLPSPAAVATALYDQFAEGGMLGHIGISVLRVWVAFVISALMAIPLGILMSSFRIVGAMTEPIVDFIRYLPVPALVPLTLIWLGIGETSKITLLWLGTFFQLVLLIADDARRVPNEFIETGLTLGARPRQLMRDIVLRAMLPSMVDNLRITLGWCWTYLIIAEIVAANAGIGYVIWAARRYVKTPEVFAGVIVIGVIGLVTDQAIRWLHRRLFAYLA